MKLRAMTRSASLGVTKGEPHHFEIGDFCKACGDVDQIECGVQDRSSRMYTYYVDWEHCKPGLGVLRGRCQFCGSEGMSHCDNNLCVPGLRISTGFVRPTVVMMTKRLAMMDSVWLLYRLSALYARCVECKIPRHVQELAIILH